MSTTRFQYIEKQKIIYWPLISLFLPLAKESFK